MSSESEAQLTRAIARIHKVSRPRHALAPFGMVLWAAQQHVLDLLDSVFYIGFSGKTGAGKGTSLESALLLTPKGGELLSASSTAALAQALEEKMAIGIPELGTALDRNDSLLKVLLDGGRRGPKHGLMIQNEEGRWVRASRDIFGAKAFDFHADAPMHLVGRSLIFEMIQNPDVDLALNAEKKAKIIEPIRTWLTACAADVHKRWTKAAVDALWDSDEFRSEVRNLKGRSGRDHILGATVLLLCRMFDWSSYEEKIPELLSTRKVVAEDSDEAEVRDVLADIAGDNPGPELVVPTTAILERINSIRERTRTRLMTAHGIGSCLLDLGYVKGPVSDPVVSWFRSKSEPFRDQWVVVPYKVAHLAQVAQTTLGEDFTSTGDGSGTSNGLEGQMGHKVEGVVGHSGPDGPHEGPIEEPGGWDTDQGSPKVPRSQKAAQDGGSGP